MAKMNWQKTHVQNRSFRYGLEIDPTVGEDPFKAPKYGKPENENREKVLNTPVVRPEFVPKTILKKNSIIITSATIRIIESLKQLSSESFLKSRDVVIKLIREIRSNVSILAKLSKSNDTMKLIEDSKKLIRLFPDQQNECNRKTKSHKINKKTPLNKNQHKTR